MSILEVPGFDSLTEDQVRGLACVWDGTPLKDATAVDVGPRTAARLDGELHWYPRACPVCATTRPLAALYDHVEDCGECGEAEGSLCVTGRMLYRLSIRGCR